MSRAVLVAGTTSMITDEAGDITGGAAGLFVDDTRHLSHWQLHVDGAVPGVLSARRAAAFGETVLVPAVARESDPPFAVIRMQALHEAGLVERLRLRNLSSAERELTVHYEVDADFADQFELRGSHAKQGGAVGTESASGKRIWRYTRDSYRKQTVVGCTQWTVTVQPHDEAVLDVWVSTEDSLAPPIEQLVADHRAAGERFVASFALPRIADERLRRCVDRGLADLASLLIPGEGGELVPAAGVPWFLTLFGRDSLITALATLPFQPGLTAATLRELAAHQGSATVPRRCEQPGKIVHELRRGELSLFGDVPYRRYYGTVDATPLFLVVLGSYYEHTGQQELVRALEESARAAVGWMLGPGGLGEHGYLVYRTDAPGLVHQCWKDSASSICFATGEPAQSPIAACEVQGYAFDALRKTAHLAREVWHDPGYAEELLAHAERLRERFLADFWMSDVDFPALALDGTRRRVDLLASNAGHLLLSGILNHAQARAVADRILDREFRSGWGLRTVAAGQPAYHPLSYHNGGVWPHDTAIAVAGLARHGLHQAARALADDILDAAAHFDYRLPEVLAGFGRDEIGTPVPYPHACSPQAWAAAAPLFLLPAFAKPRQ